MMASTGRSHMHPQHDSFEHLLLLSANKIVAMAPEDTVISEPSSEMEKASSPIGCRFFFCPDILPERLRQAHERHLGSLGRRAVCPHLGVVGAQWFEV